jgi:AraC family transcriptional regulator
MANVVANCDNTGNPVARTMSTQNFFLSERKYASLYQSQLHVHAKHYLIITIEGKYASTFDTRTEEFTPWTVTYHQAGLSHSSRYSARGARVLYVELPKERLKDLWELSASHLNHFSLQGGLVDWVARQLYNEFRASDHFSSIVIDGLVMQLLAHLLRQRRACPLRIPRWLGTADEMIRSRYAEPLPLIGIAKFVQVHPGHLAREYVRHYGCTIGEQVRRLRIEFACDQLSSTDQCLADIALGAGFSDQSHFTTSFRQHIGMPPSRYRKVIKTMLFSQQNVNRRQDASERQTLSIENQVRA